MLMPRAIASSFFAAFFGAEEAEEGDVCLEDTGAEGDTEREEEGDTEEGWEGDDIIGSDEVEGEEGGVG